MGVPMRRPPANALPPFAEWQATQSPARARYSPLLAVAMPSAVSVSGVTAGWACRGTLAPKTKSATAKNLDWLIIRSTLSAQHVMRAARHRAADREKE